MRTPNARIITSIVIYISAFFFQRWWILIPFSMLFISNIVFFFFLYKKRQRKKGIIFLAESLLLDMLIAGSLVFLPKQWIIYFVILVGIISSGILWRVYYVFMYHIDEYQDFSIQNVTNFISVLLVYLSSLIFSSFGIFFGVATWWSLLGFVVVIFIIHYLQFYIHKIRPHKILLLSLVLGVFSAEFFWIIKYLPLSFYVNAASITVVLYFCSSIFRFYAFGSLNRLIWYRYVGLSTTALLLILGTAHWN